MNQQTNILALIPIDFKDRMEMAYTPHPGSGRLPCEKCGIACWIGPRQTMAKVSNPEMFALCMICAVKEIGKYKNSGEEFKASIVPLGD